MTSTIPAGAAPPPSPTASPPGRDSLWTPTHLPLAIAAVTLVTLGAYENRAVITVLPRIVEELDGMQWFGLASGASSLTFLVATALAGVVSDHVGPRPVLVAGVTTFVLAQAITGLAPSIAVLLAGRAASGVAEGLLDIGLLVLIADGLPSRLRAKVFALFAIAWMLPSLLGPFVAGVVAEHWGWRAVFLTPLVLLAPATLALAPSLRLARPRTPSSWTPDEGGTVAAAALVAGAVAALTWGGAALTTSALALPAVAAGAVVMALAWRHLLPRGTASLAPGVPATVAIRLLVTATFTGLGTFLPLLLVSVHHVSLRLAGISLAVTGTFWAVGSMLSSRDAVLASTTPAQRVRGAMLLMVVGAAGPALLALGVVGLAVGMLGWCLSALGMGIAANTLAVHTVDIAPDDSQGEVNAAVTLAAALGGSLATAVGGAVIAARADHLTGTPFALIVVASAALGVVAVAGAHRLVPEDS